MKIDNALLDEIYNETKRLQKEEEVDNEAWAYYNGMIHMLETLQTLDKDIYLSNNNDSLKEYALAIIDDLEEDGYDLQEGSWLLQWRYEERPDVPVTIIIGEFTEIDESSPGDFN